VTKALGLGEVGYSTVEISQIPADVAAIGKGMGIGRLPLLPRRRCSREVDRKPRTRASRWTDPSIDTCDSSRPFSLPKVWPRSPGRKRPQSSNSKVDV
jgi:hypothetical protein